MNSFDELSLYKKMLLIRLAEEKIQKHYSEDIFKTPVHLSIGAEAIACGVLEAFPKRRVYGTYRNHHWFLAATNNLVGFFAELLGKQKAPNGGRAGSMHLSDPQNDFILTSAVVSSTIPIALGDSWAEQSKIEKKQTLVFFGDGATEEGVFWETLNFSALKKIPLLFVCEDNDLAIHSTKKSRQAFDIKKTVESFGVHFVNANGSDVESVFKAAQKSKDLLKAGPVFLRLDYFRALEHVGISSDFHFNYRTKPADLNSNLDPLWISAQRLKVPSAEIKNIIQAEVEAAFDLALSYPDADASTVSDHVLKKALI